MAVPKFDPAELKIAYEKPGFGGGPGTPVYSYPVSPKEGMKAAMARKPLWQITHSEQQMFLPSVNPDNIARALCVEAQRHTYTTDPVADMFGVEWEFVPKVGGSMVRPGQPLIEDMNDWRDFVKFPDIDQWDWEGSAKLNEKFLDTDAYICCWILNGWYERLISFMEFEGAAMALIDEDQQDAVKEFFSELSDFYIKMIGRYLDTFPQIDGFCIHDDWGSQRETFFAPDVAAEMIVPYMRRVNDYIHSRGRFSDFHSCGMALKQIPNMIDAGWDAWSGQPMNDTQKIYELYGDKILIGVIPSKLDPKMSDDELRESAREYAEKFCNPEKPSILNIYSNMGMPRAFRDELYKQSRIRYSGGC